MLEPGVLLVGLDVGTTGAKAVVFDGAGSPKASARRSIVWQPASNGGAETSADALRQAAFDALRAALDEAPEGTVAGIGIASLAESGIVLDTDDRAVAPVIAWYDERDVSERRALIEVLGADRFATTTGLPAGQQWSLTKSRWISEHVPEAAASGRLRLSVAEWIAYALGGRAASEPSLASRTGWLDLRTREWWGEALEFSRVPTGWLPELLDAGTDLGPVTAAVHARLTGARIAVAGHDHQSAAVGAGAWNAGDVLDSCGTAEALVRTADPGLDDPVIGQLTRAGVTVGWHALPGRWCLLGATQGGRTLGRVLDALGVTDVTRSLDAAALGAADPDAARVSVPDAVLPHATDHLPSIGDVATEQELAALVSRETRPGAVWLAAVTGVTGEAAALDALMTHHAGPRRRMLAVGGWTASTALLAAKRQQFGAVEIPDVREAGARGAALFAGVAAGLWEHVAESSW